MNIRHASVLATSIGLVTLLIVDSVSRSQEIPAEPQGAEVQARGPVHEAFAEPTDLQPQPGPVVPKQPPDPIDELPPDQKPQGDNVQWIPGYWSWDDESNDFIWISGCWRDIPPGRSWVPGHWQVVENGWMWVSGFWAPSNLQEVQYLPPPPPTIDQGPSAPAPDANSAYAPGCWVYQQNRYMWRPGHWIAFQPNWVWVPAHYIWTPAGCVFVDDYWDYPLDQRGLLFAPCRFDLRVWAGLRKPFVPQLVIEPDFLIGALFVNTGNHHYYFGDFFEDRYQRRFVPWTDYHPGPGAADANFAYYRHVHAQNAGWENNLRELYRARRTGEIQRPPRTFSQQNLAVKNFNINKTTNNFVRKDVNITNMQNVRALAPLGEIHNSKVTHLGSLGKQEKELKAPPPPAQLKVQAVPKEEHLREQKAATQMREAATQRRELEAKMLNEGHVPVKHTDAPHTVKMPVPQPPQHAAQAQQNATQTQHPVRTPPPKVSLPKHEERPIPKYEPPHPPAPKKEKDKKG
jgi:hypothetical protein